MFALDLLTAAVLETVLSLFCRCSLWEGCSAVTSVTGQLIVLHRYRRLHPEWLTMASEHTLRATMKMMYFNSNQTAVG